MRGCGLTILKSLAYNHPLDCKVRGDKGVVMRIAVTDGCSARVIMALLASGLKVGPMVIEARMNPVDIDKFVVGVPVDKTPTSQGPVKRGKKGKAKRW